MTEQNEQTPENDAHTRENARIRAHIELMRETLGINRLTLVATDNPDVIETIERDNRQINTAIQTLENYIAEPLSTNADLYMGNNMERAQQ